MGINKKILRIADRGQHAAQVGRNGLPCQYRNHFPEPMGFFEKRNRQGYKNDKRHIVGDGHGRKETSKNKKTPHLASGRISFEEKTKPTGKKPALPEPRHDGHETEKQGQKRTVHTVRHRRRTPWDKQRGDER